MSTKDNDLFTFSNDETPSTETKTDRSGWTYPASVAAYPDESVVEYIDELIESENTEWAYPSQFARDAIEYYMEADEIDYDAKDLLEYSGHDQPITEGPSMTINITSEIGEKIDHLIDHPHTPWETKYEFSLCAISFFVLETTPELDL